MAVSLLALNPFLADLIQTGAIEREIRDALIAETMFRMDIESEIFEGKIGEVKSISRAGLLPVSIAPLTPGTDPVPQQFAMETFLCELHPYGGTVDAYLPNDRVGVNKESMLKASRVAIQCAQSLDRLARQAMYQAYLAGNTCLIAAAPIGATQLHVASLNGFTVINSATDNRPVAVSALNPLAITFGGGLEPANTVTAFTPDDPNAPMGPGWLTLGAALTVGPLAREAVLAANRSQVIYVGGGNSVDALGAANTLTMNDLINATGQLEQGPASVPMFDAGMYHCHLGTAAKVQLLQDPLVRGMLQSDKIPEAYKKAAIGELGGAMLIGNKSVPTQANSGTLVSSGAGASFCSPEIGADVINNAGLNIGYTLVYGRGHLYESYVPAGAIAPDQSISSQQATPPEPAESSGTSLNVDRAEFIIRPPLDRLNEITAFSWKFKGDWPAPSDITTQARRFRRGVVVAHVIP